MNGASKPRGRTLFGRAITGAWLLTGGWALGSGAYLLIVLSGAARARAGSGPPPAVGSAELLVLVPAHEEEAVIAPTVEALLSQDYPSERRRVVVIADNCTDDTAGAARRAGAIVWERNDRASRGKGAALAWAIDRALRELPEVEGVVVVDADCQASGNLLRVIAGQFAAGAGAVQADYLAANPEASSMAGLRAAAFRLMNTVRPMGKFQLGFSAGLLGTGMAFSRRTLTDLPWSAFSVTEDREYHLRMLERGIRVAFAAQASVTTPVPTTLRQGAVQQIRWDTGNALMGRQWAARLALAGLRLLDPHRLHAAVELIVPPQATLVSLNAAGAAIARLSGSRTLRGLSLASTAMQAVYVTAGVALVDSPMTLVRVAPAIPGLVAARLAQQARILTGRGAKSWVRTDRSSWPPAGG